MVKSFRLYFGRFFLLHAVSRSEVIVVISGWGFTGQISQSTLSGFGREPNGGKYEYLAKYLLLFSFRSSIEHGISHWGESIIHLFNVSWKIFSRQRRDFVWSAHFRVMVVLNSHYTNCTHCAYKFEKKKFWFWPILQNCIFWPLLQGHYVWSSHIC